jgi:hypothetical protein
MIPYTHRPWLFLPPLFVYVCDVGLTLLGQPAAYWAGDHGVALEINPLARALLIRGPIPFLGAAVVWAAVFTVLISSWRSRLVVVLAYLLTFGHAIGASTWLVSYGWPGLFAAVGLLIAAERLLHWFWI